jgi:hypothetical protein
MDIPATAKERRLLKSLKASTMKVPVATIKAQASLCTDFDATVNYLCGFISIPDQETCNVLQVETKGPHGKKASKMNPHSKSKRDDKTRNPRIITRWIDATAEMSRSSWTLQ